MKRQNKTIVRPGARRPMIPPGVVVKSRLDRRKEEKKKSWKKELSFSGLDVLDQDRE